ncbi:hypothetical protein IQ07DRAFT_31607 [Pyrenochaeta sp. DS3sAY3a]|nr:hypothetical protein IQ07DRAFT_31607 [Pyrenochaeta sp. DS3sAY3a]
MTSPKIPGIEYGVLWRMVRGSYVARYFGSGIMVRPSCYAIRPLPPRGFREGGVHSLGCLGRIWSLGWVKVYKYCDGTVVIFFHAILLTWLFLKTTESTTIFWIFLEH